MSPIIAQLYIVALKRKLPITLENGYYVFTQALSPGPPYQFKPGQLGIKTTVSLDLSEIDEKIFAFSGDR